MPETANIAQVSNTISEKIFSVFGWERRPAKDQNWKCVEEAHKKRTHPSDVVFSYDDPVEHERIYLTTDLKSYARGSITLAAVKKALKSLAMSTECANKSEEFQNLYVNPEHNYKVAGLLFIYNHDGDFEKDFHTIIEDVSSTSIKLRAAYRLFVLGPQQIDHLFIVANDILTERGGGYLSSAQDCRFYYPDLIRTRVKSKMWSVANIEMLTSPWQILRFAKAGKNKNESGYFFYYRGEGKSADEFKYLLDYMFRYQLVELDEEIAIRMSSPHPQAPSFFATAKEQYAADYFDLPEFRERLGRIQLKVIQTVHHSFNLVAGGI